MILESKDHFDQLAELDPDTGTYRFLSRKEQPELATTQSCGGYSLIDGTMVSLYRVDGVLYFRVGDQNFKLTDDVTSKLTREVNKQVFWLLEGGPLFKFEYVPTDQDIPLSMDPTPFVEEEDFDFLLFVHNVLAEPGRRHRVYRG